MDFSEPVHGVLGGGPVNLVMGDPPYDLWFEAVDSAGRRVRPIDRGAYGRRHDGCHA